MARRRQARSRLSEQQIPDSVAWRRGWSGHVQGQNPTDPGGSSQALQEPRDGKVIDITSRLPVREPLPPVVLEPAPTHAPRRPERARLLVPLVWLVVGVGAGLWGGHFWGASHAHRAAVALMRGLEQANGLEVRWPQQENRPLRLMGLPDQRRALSRAPATLSLEQEREAELWLLEAAERSDALALRALATYHLQQAESQRSLFLAKSALETHQAQRGPDSSVLNDLAVVMALLDQLPQASLLLKQALELDPREPVILYNAAQVARASGARAIAQEKDLVFKYLLLDPGSRWKPAMEQRYRYLSDFGIRSAPVGSPDAPGPGDGPFLH